MLKRPGVYLIRCSESGKVYVGQTVDLDRRKKDHIRALRKGEHHNGYLQRAFDKYGEEKFAFSVLQECAVDELDSVETMWIRKLDAMNPDNGYNLESGGNPGKIVSESTRDKKRGRNNPQYGKKISAAHVEALRIKNRGHNSGLTERDVENIKLSLLGGKPASALAKKYGLSVSAVQSISGGKNWGYVRPDLTESLVSRRAKRDDEIRRLSGSGLSRAKIAAQVGCTPATVTRVLGSRSDYFTDSEAKQSLKREVELDFLAGLSREEIMQKHGISAAKYVSCISEAYNKGRESTTQKAREYRALGWKVKDIAKELGFARTTISRWTADMDSCKHRGNHGE